jgi:hypothetical protein
MIEAASASALHPHLSRSPLAHAFGSFVHRRWPNPSVKGTSRKRAAPYVER